MYIKLDEAFVMAAVGLSPLAEVVIRDRDQDFTTDAEFAAFHQLLLAELADFTTKVNELVEKQLTVDVNSIGEARNLVNLIRVFAYKKIAGALVGNGTASVTTATTPQVTPISPSATTYVPPLAVQGATATIVPKPDPNGSEKCFQRGCGQAFASFNEVMAHKCLVHGYNSGKWTLGWARDFMRNNAGAGVVASLVTPDPDPDPGLVTQTNLWTPRLHLDLRNLDLQIGEASRFAAGEQHDARFYFIRQLKQPTTIKGKFVWSKFAHRFNTQNVYNGDFVVRKLAGDTKEWVGVQAKAGVYNPAHTWANKSTVPRFHFENVYVGDHEDDLLEILNDPHKARINYGKWRQECGYCGRNLTDAESRLRGIGPDCWEQKYLPSLGRKYGAQT